MPSQRLIASNALMCLNGYRNGSSDSVGSDIYYTGEDLDQDIDIAICQRPAEIPQAEWTPDKQF